MQTQQGQSAALWTKNPPYSLDPLTYDYSGHHLAFTSAFAPLVSFYQRGAVIGVVAETWISSNDFTSWEFDLRKGLTFSNGDPITAEAVAKSLKRVAFLQKRSDSKSGLFEHLIGLESFQTMSDDLEGVRLHGQKLVLRFNQPMPRLLETISFGLYGITHPDDYEEATGAWKHAHQARTSGAYRVAEWTDERLKLVLNETFPKHLRHNRPWPKITIFWHPQDVEKADIHEGDSFNHSLSDAFEFHTTSATSVSIAYIQCFPWRDKRSPCHDLNLRRLLRREFYRAMKQQGYAPPQSFFPRQLTTFVGEPEAITRSKAASLSLPYRILQSRRTYPPFSLAMEALQTAARELNLAPHISLAPAEIIPQLITGSLPEYPYDTAALVTGILLDDARDARFMIQSKEGICLPDPDGRLHVEAAKAELDYNKLEEILWDQALIWPLAHFQAGVWARKGTFDFSQINLDLPATDFSWIGMKE